MLIFENVSTFSSVKTCNMGIIDTQKHRKKIIDQTCVCLCCDDLYLRILGVLFLNGIDSTKVTRQQKYKFDRYFCFLSNTYISLWDEYQGAVPSQLCTMFYFLVPLFYRIHFTILILTKVVCRFLTLPSFLTFSLCPFTTEF